MEWNLGAILIGVVLNPENTNNSQTPMKPIETEIDILIKPFANVCYIFCQKY